MTPTEARSAIVDAIAQVAPDADVGALAPDAEMAEELELDSMDFLNIVVAVEEHTGITVPERDYPLLASLDDFTAYLIAAAP